MSKIFKIPHLRLGGTSFLIHADYVKGTRFCAERCDDVALLLLDGIEFPTKSEIQEMSAILDSEGASLHVHLPTSSTFTTRKSTKRMIDQVQSAIDCSNPLHPHSYVLHLDFNSKDISDDQVQGTAEALQKIADCLPQPELLAIENLTGFPVNFCDRWIRNTSYSRCLDIGHIWKDDKNPLPILTEWLPKIRVLHLHGVKNGVFDHNSLKYMSTIQVDAVMHRLWQKHFAGVVTLEMFSVDDFDISCKILLQSWNRFRSPPLRQAVGLEKSPKCL